MPLLKLLPVLTLAFALPSLAQTERQVPVDKGVSLQVLDWGGTGRPLVLLTGLGSEAHVYDHLAQQLEPPFHVYAISRRGFGQSSKPPATVANYSAERLGEDVVAVIEALKLTRPLVAGHSIAGEELSYLGNRHPDMVAGLIYLDASDAYGLYDPAAGDWQLDMIAVRNEVAEIEKTGVINKQVFDTMQADTARLNKDVQSVQADQALLPGPPPPPMPAIPLAIRFGEQKFLSVHAPTLAIIACPHDFGPAPGSAEVHKALAARDLPRCTEVAKHFQAAVPGAKVHVIPNASHLVFQSHEAVVVSDIKAFAAGLR